jgi:hypothetical protein
MRDMYNSFDEILSLIKEGMRPSPNQVGSLFSINGRIIGFDLFTSTGTLRKHLEMLVESMAVDALEYRMKSPPPSRDEVLWLEGLGFREVTPQPPGIRYRNAAGQVGQ